MIHLRAEKNWLKRKGALCRPKGRTISKKYRPCHFTHSSSQSEGWTGMFWKAASMSSLDIKQTKRPRKILENDNRVIYLNVLERIVFSGH